MATMEKSIDVDVPVTSAYEQWTRFEEFPQFMEGVKEVRKVDDSHLHWVAEIGNKPEEWDARIIDQQPDRKVAWQSEDGAKNAGIVTFDVIDDHRTRVNLLMAYEPTGLVESVGDVLGFVSRKVQGDLERFKSFVESPSRETSAWRGSS
jgi:uncharacterized membrane protein